MKEHLSITIDKKTAMRLRRYAKREGCPVSQVVEMSIEKLTIVTGRRNRHCG
jgi:cytidylate kinase